MTLSAADREGGDWQLRKPLRSQAVLSLFNDLAHWLQEEEGRGRQSEGEVRVWLGQPSLQDALTWIVSQGQPAVLRLNDEKLLAIDPAAGRYASSAGAHTLFTTMSAGQVGISPAPDWESATRLVPGATAPRKFAELQWISCLRGGPSTPLAEDAPVRLSRWPNFTQLPHSYHHLRLAALLTGGSATPAQVARASGQPLAEVNRFLSACAAIGLLAAEASAAPPPPKPAPVPVAELEPEAGIEPEVPLAPEVAVDPELPAEAQIVVQPEIALHSEAPPVQVEAPVATGPAERPALRIPERPVADISAPLPVPATLLRAERAGILRGLLRRLGIAA